VAGYPFAPLLYGARLPPFFPLGPSTCRPRHSDWLLQGFEVAFSSGHFITNRFNRDSPGLVFSGLGFFSTAQFDWAGVSSFRTLIFSASRVTPQIPSLPLVFDQPLFPLFAAGNTPSFGLFFVFAARGFFFFHPGCAPIVDLFCFQPFLGPPGAPQMGTSPSRTRKQNRLMLCCSLRRCFCSVYLKWSI